MPIFRYVYFHTPEAYSGQYQPSKMERLAKIGNDFHLRWSLLRKKPVNNFCKTLHLRGLTGFSMSLCSQSTHENWNANILVYFKELRFLKANQLTTNQIDWFLCERDYGHECVEKWINFLRNTW